MSHVVPCCMQLGAGQMLQLYLHINEAYYSGIQDTAVSYFTQQTDYPSTDPSVEGRPTHRTVVDKLSNHCRTCVEPFTHSVEPLSSVNPTGLGQLSNLCRQTCKHATCRNMYMLHGKNE